MSGKWPGGFINKAAPSVSTSGASGIWTLDQVADYVAQGIWPSPIPPLSAYFAGDSGYGQLGNGTTSPDVSNATQLGAAGDFALVVAQRRFAVATTSVGALYTWGQGADGQLGNGGTANTSSPVQVGALTNWGTPKSAPTSTGCITVKTDGTMWGWGSNDQRQLGNGFGGSNVSSPVQVGNSTSDWVLAALGANGGIAVKPNGAMWTWGDYRLNGQGGVNKDTPAQLGALTTWASGRSSFSCGSLHAGAVKTDGTLWMWGTNANGELGQGNTTTVYSPVQVGALTSWAKISCGERAVMAIKTDGTLWAWGYQTYNTALMLGNNVVYSSPVQVGSDTDWTDVCLGYSNSYATKTDGTLWACGQNAQGQLMQGNTTQVSSPVQVGSGTNWSNPSGTFSNFFGMSS